MGLSPSIHLVKAVAILEGLGWDIHLMGSMDQAWHEDFDHCTIHHLSDQHPAPQPTATKHVTVHPVGALGRDRRLHRAETIARIVDDVCPDIVHSHEFQAGAYTTLLARSLCAQPFPAWIVSSWGSDIYFYGRDAQHRRAIEHVLSLADGFGAECIRDVTLARAAGFRGLVLPVVPNAGGYDLAQACALRAVGPASHRTAVAVKGYQHRFGRAISALDALDGCGDLLAGRELLLYSASQPAVTEHARRLANVHHARLTVVNDVPNSEIIRLHGRARVSIGLSISDGASTCFLETLLGGSFPVQSFTACASEWVIDGTSALLVDPTNQPSVVRAIRRALTDDDLVDSAQAINDRTVAARLDRATVRAAVADGYRQVAAHWLGATGAAR